MFRIIRGSTAFVLWIRGERGTGFNLARFSRRKFCSDLLAHKKSGCAAAGFLSAGWNGL